MALFGGGWGKLRDPLGGAQEGCSCLHCRHWREGPTPRLWLVALLAVPSQLPAVLTPTTLTAAVLTTA